MRPHHVGDPHKWGRQWVLLLKSARTNPWRSISSAAGAKRTTIPRGCSTGAIGAILRGMKRNLPAPTLEELRRDCAWCWVVCERCLHREAVAFVPLIIRWGSHASSDLLRRSARYGKCGARGGASLQHPSWGGMDVGWEPFPATRTPIDISMPESPMRGRQEAIPFRSTK
jgi:hypothetical protein